MTSLRHLKIKNCARLARLPGFIGRLRNLQSMPIFIAGKTWEEGILQLLELQNLPGELKIKHLENVERRHVARTYLISEDLPGNRRDYCLENMHLNSLGLSWGDADEHNLSVSMRGPRSQTGHQSVETARILLDSTLKPNSRIKKLFVNGYPGTEFPNWMNAAALCNLIQLELANCTNCESLPTLGELPLLKVLRIQGMDSVVNIGNEFFGGMRAFSSLTEFSLKDFPKLETWSTNPVEAFTCLNKLTIINCPVLITMPWISSTCRDQKLPPSDATVCSTATINLHSHYWQFSGVTLYTKSTHRKQLASLVFDNFLLSQTSFIACKCWTTPELEVSKNRLVSGATLFATWFDKSDFSGVLGDY
jgi:structure-specific endonuclease subunit SLX1